jgi:hypothetical protein
MPRMPPATTENFHLLQSGTGTFCGGEITEVLRRIFGPTQKANGEWRLKTNEELEKAINNESIVRNIKYK